MNVRWSARALGHIESIYEYIAADSPGNAARVVDRIVSRLQQIETFPESGRVVPEIGFSMYREVVEAPYRIIYRVGRNAIFLVAILHSSRHLRASLLS